MLKRIIINFLLAFGVLPVLVPLLRNFIILIWRADGAILYTWDSSFQLYWGGVIAYCSVFVFLFVFGIYELVVITYFRRRKRPLNFIFKLFYFLILLSILLTVSDQAFFFAMGHDCYYLKFFILLFSISIVMVTLHYFLIDRKYERRISDGDNDKIEEAGRK